MGVLQGRLGGVGEGLGVGQGLLGLGLVGVQGVVQLLDQIQGGIGVLGHPVGQVAQLVVPHRVHMDGVVALRHLPRSAGKLA